VTTLRLDRQDPNRVIAHIRVETQTPVRTDSVAQLNFQGITGVTFIQILAGDPSAPLLASVNGETPQIPTSRTLVDELFSGGQDLLSVSGDTIRKVNEMLSEENLLHLTSTLASIDTAISKVAKDGGIIDEAALAMKNINTAIVALETAAITFDQAASSLASDFSTLSTDASATLKKLDPTLDEAREAMRNVNETVAAINWTSRQPQRAQCVRWATRQPISKSSCSVCNRCSRRSSRIQAALSISSPRLWSVRS
jgi:phospholipid/cholesterol/gamma-HCH transport system substrate-binding protein